MSEKPVGLYMNAVVRCGSKLQTKLLSLATLAILQQRGEYRPPGELAHVQLPERIPLEVATTFFRRGMASIAPRLGTSLGGPACEIRKGPQRSWQYPHDGFFVFLFDLQHHCRPILGWYCGVGECQWLWNYSYPGTTQHRKFLTNSVYYAACTSHCQDFDENSFS